MPRHYCRKDSTKLYLDRDLRIVSEVHKLMNINYCSLHQVKPLKSTVFGEVFNRKNLSLFKPKKDRCNACIVYEVGHVTEEEWQGHMRFKDAANTEKETDKARAEASLGDKNKKFAAFCTDLESVVVTPST